MVRPLPAQSRHSWKGHSGCKGLLQVTDDAAADYALGLSKLAQHADYLVINVSSPNTPGELRLHPAVQACPRSSLHCNSSALQEAGLTPGWSPACQSRVQPAVPVCRCGAAG